MAIGVSGSSVITTVQGDNIIMANTVYGEDGTAAGEAYAIKADNEKHEIISITGSNIIYGTDFGIEASNGSQIDLIAGQVNGFSGGEAGVALNDSALRGWGDTMIMGDAKGLSINDGSTVELHGKQHIIKSWDSGSIAFDSSGSTATIDGTLKVQGGQNAVNAVNSTVAVNGNDNAFIADTADADSAAIKAVNSVIDIAGASTVVGGQYGVKAEGSNVTFTSYSGNNYFVSAASRDDNDLANTDDEFSNAVNVSGQAQFTATGRNNILAAGEIKNGYGKETAISAVGGTAELNAAENNELHGAIYANNGTVKLSAQNGDNIVLSSTHGRNAGEDNSGIHLVSALYAVAGSEISLSAQNGVNRIYSSFDFVAGHDKDREITVWSEDGGSVNLNGAVEIVASNGGNYTNGLKNNSLGIAVSAGGREITAADKNLDGTLKEFDGQWSTVNINYGSAVSDSRIVGDIVAGYGGAINIAINSQLTDEGFGRGNKLIVQGNILAANGGKLDLDLGEGGVWYGRADDYQDAGKNGHGSNGEGSFFNPVFSDTIYTSGEVNVTLGKGSKWYLTGQSWITTINGITDELNSDANKPVIDIAKSNVWLGDKGEATSSALTIGTLNGNVRFNMHLDGNKLTESDMLYIKNANGNYDVSLHEAVTTEEINNGHDGLRFATVGKGSNAEFRVGSYDKGVFNVEYEVGTDIYKESEENAKYNGNCLNSNKPGNTSVNDFFGENQQISTWTEGIESTGGLDETTNFKIVARKGEELSDGGKTVVNMSKVNYNNAVYMDRLNKRLGEARYINPEDEQGMWVRLRHDRIGKDNEFRIMNTMYEIGYDEKQECANGERRVGAAIDYMDGSSEYTAVGGSGDVSRKGIWLYDTWMGDKGHYSDFVAKWGRLDNDFTIYRNNEKISGDFSNNVYSISAEYGRKKDIGNNWYFEPQVQLQYARVTDAAYTTSQGTAVNLDTINSLIARAGFRLGKDLGDRSTVYFKADILHEFLGDQDIYARDNTTDGEWAKVTYGNEGTWCDVGFGFATAMSKTSYAYLDLETSLGNDYEKTYQINAGMQWTF